ncbi:MAG TPA: GNAT family N-acetyltransferase [Pseudobdellovibrionaceae bacterium]|nr:GNAT family N-acetyltransferase [Pseudobdellovibrionaceae bacterium]
MNLLYSLCTAEDIPKAVDFVNAAYRGENSKAGWTTEESLLGGQRTDADMMRSLCTPPGNQIWLAREEVFGVLVGLFHLERGPDRTFLGMLTVDPRSQDAGIGKQLIRKAEELARSQWGLQELYMTVISLRHELIAYYERRGYLPTGEKKDFPMNDPRYGIPKRNDFHLMVLKKSL